MCIFYQLVFKAWTMHDTVFRAQHFQLLKGTDLVCVAFCLQRWWPSSNNMNASVSAVTGFKLPSFLNCWQKIHVLGFFTMSWKMINIDENVTLVISIWVSKLCAMAVAVVDFRQLEANTTDGADDMNALAKWRILNRLHDRNETLYYHVRT